MGRRQWQPRSPNDSDARCRKVTSSIRPAFAKIHPAHPLDDRDQWSWLAKVAAWIDGCRRLGTGGVITCSALRRSYRDFLTRGRPEVRLVYLHGERPLIDKRLAARKEHSVLPDILDRHFAILEEPDSDEDPIVVDVSSTCGGYRCGGSARARPGGAGESTGYGGPR